MSTRVSYNTASAVGQQVSEYIDALNDALARGRRLKGQLDSAVAGGTYTALEAEVGGMVAGTGQDFWTILSTAQAAIDVPAVAELKRIDQG